MKNLAIAATAVILVVIAGAWWWRVHTYRTAAILQPYEITAGGDRQYVAETDVYSVELVYPSETPLYSALDPVPDYRARMTLETGLKAELDNFLENSGVQDLSGFAKDAALAHPYELKTNYALFTSPHFVSYKFDIYLDTGGAHPNGYYQTHVFDRQGDEVGLEDLFTPGSDYLNKLAAESKRQVVSEMQKRTGESASTTEANLFLDGLLPKAENFSNFALDGGTLRIFLPPYQVAAYAAGPFEVAIPLSELRELLRKDIP